MIGLKRTVLGLVILAVLVLVVPAGWAQTTDSPLSQTTCLTTGTVSVGNHAYVEYDMTLLLTKTSGQVASLISQKAVILKVRALDDGATSAGLMFFRQSNTSTAVDTYLDQSSPAKSGVALPEGDVQYCYLTGRYFQVHGWGNTSKFRLERVK